MGCFVPPWLYAICLHLTRGLSKWSPSFPALHFETFQVFLIYFSKCPRFSTIQSPAPSVALLTSLFLKLKFGYAGESRLLHIECCFCNSNPGFNITCTYYLSYYYATQIVEIFHILQLFLIYNNVYCGWLTWGFHYRFFFHVYFLP